MGEKAQFLDKVEKGHAVHFQVAQDGKADELYL